MTKTGIFTGTGTKNGRFDAKTGEELLPRQIAFFFLAVLPLTKVIGLPPLLCAKAENDLWFPYAVYFAADGAMLLFALWCVKRGATFSSLCEAAFGKRGGKVVILLYAAFFLVKTYIPLGEERYFVENSLYEAVPRSYFFLPVFLVGAFFAVRRRAVFGRLMDLLWPVTIAAFAMLLALSFSSAKWEALLPVLYDKTRLFPAVKAAAFYFGDHLPVLVFAGRFRIKKGDGGRILGGFAFAAAVTLFLAVQYYAVFTVLGKVQEESVLHLAKFTLSRASIGRVDFLAVYGLLLSSAVGLFVPAFLAADLLSGVLPFRREWIVCTGFVLLAAANYFTFENFAVLSAFFREKLFAVALVFQYLLPLFMMTAFLIKSKKRGDAPEKGVKTHA